MRKVVSCTVFPDRVGWKIGACREHTQLRDHDDSEPVECTHPFTKIGRVIQVRATNYSDQNGIEIQVISMLNYGSFSWIVISWGPNRHVKEGCEECRQIHFTRHFFSCTSHAFMMCILTTWVNCLHARVTSYSCHPWWAVGRLFVASVLFWFEFFLPCGQRKGNWSSRFHQPRSLALWQDTLFSHVMSPISLTISTTRRLLKWSSRRNPATKIMNVFMRWKNWSDFKIKDLMNFREEDWSKIKTLFINSRPEFRIYRMKLIVWTFREILKMLNQYAVDIPTLPVNLCLSHFIQFLAEC